MCAATHASPKMLVIGVDGATLDVIEPLAAGGDLPTFARLLKSGAWGTMRSTVPFVSPVAWASFMTGQNPGRHRIMDFTVSPPGSNLRLPVNAAVLKGTPLWQRLGRAGKRVGVINVPVTFPPQPVNGFLISGFPMPRGTRNYTHPPHLAADLEARGWNLADIAGQTTSPRELDAFIAGLYRRHHQRIKATLWLMEAWDWDFMMVHLFESDRIQHELFNYWARHVAGQAGAMARRYAPELKRFFQAIDRAIEQLWQALERLAPGSTLVVMSDHGFGPTHKAVHLGNWLQSTGLMTLKPALPVRLKTLLARAGLTPVNVYRLLPPAVTRRLQNAKDVTRLKGSQSGDGLSGAAARLLRRAAGALVLNIGDVDWERTRALFSGDSGLIHLSVNLQGRQPQGSVPPAAYESTRDEIIAALRNWRDPDDGGPVVSEIYRREELYHGPYAHEAADILALFRGDSEYIALNAGDYFLSNRVIEPHYRQRATHKMNGLVIICDPRARPGYRIPQTQIVDLAPTLLHLMGLPIPANMDGAVIQAAFRPGWWQAHPPQTVPADDALPPDDDSTGLSPQEEAAMLQMLKDLGYVE